MSPREHCGHAISGFHGRPHSGFHLETLEAAALGDNSLPTSSVCRSLGSTGRDAQGAQGPGASFQGPLTVAGIGAALLCQGPLALLQDGQGISKGKIKLSSN